jgi:hypothetical protein
LFTYGIYGSGEEDLKKFAVFTGFWPKYDLEMKIKDKSPISIILHVLRQSLMQTSM